MCTKAKGKRIHDTYNKYLNEREVDHNDVEYLEILADSENISYSFRDGKVFAKSI